MKLKTIRVRRSHPSALSWALALMLTMLCVYMLSLSEKGDARQVSAPANARNEIHLPGLEAVFQCEGRYDTSLDARLAAARCVQNGGAGLILQQDGGYAVIFQAGGDGNENAFTRRCDGLTLRSSGPSDAVAALEEAAAFLQALHSESAGLASSLLRGDTNATSIAALMRVYRTRGERIQAALAAVPKGGEAVDALQGMTSNALTRINYALHNPAAASLRLLHAGACADWISLLEQLRAMAA